MKYRRLGKTGLMVSEIGFGAEWMERHSAQECKAVLDRAEELGINILDCWMSEPNVSTSLGRALAGRRERWYIQGHIKYRFFSIPSPEQTEGTQRERKRERGRDGELPGGDPGEHRVRHPRPRTFLR